MQIKSQTIKNFKLRKTVDKTLSQKPQPRESERGRESGTQSPTKATADNKKVAEMWRQVNVALGRCHWVQCQCRHQFLTPFSCLFIHTSELVSEFSHKIQSENDKLFSAFTFKRGKPKGNAARILLGKLKVKKAAGQFYGMGLRDTTRSSSFYTHSCMRCVSRMKVQNFKSFFVRFIVALVNRVDLSLLFSPLLNLRQPLAAKFMRLR